MEKPAILAAPPTPPPLPEEESPRPARKISGLGDWLRGAGVTLLLAVFLLIGYGSFSLVREFVASGGKNIGFYSPPSGPEGTAGPGITPTLFSLEGPAYKPWNGVERVTILAMGLDYREGGTEPSDGPSRTDTMLLLSMDPVTKTAGMLSIPRDLWVDIPGIGFDRINSAYYYAELPGNRFPGGGPALAMKTVETLVGMPIDYYAVLDFNSFTKFVDEIGGIDVYVPFDNMVVDPVGKGNTTLLFFGWNHLDGALALGFARNRHTEGGDFDRAARTQQVIMAIRDKILNLNMLPTLLLKAPTLYNDLAGGVKTNLSFDQIIQLALVAKDISRKNIRQGVIDNTDLLATDSIGGADLLIPNLEKIRELRDQIFTSLGPLGYAIPPADLDSLAPLENAKIQILNGSGRDGMAGATKDFLVGKGFSADNITTGTADTQYATSRVIDYSGMPYTVGYLAKLMNLDSDNLFSQVSLDGGVDVQIIVGYDMIKIILG